MALYSQHVIGLEDNDRSGLDYIQIHEYLFNFYNDQLNTVKEKASLSLGDKIIKMEYVYSLFKRRTGLELHSLPVFRGRKDPQKLNEEYNDCLKVMYERHVKGLTSALLVLNQGDSISHIPKIDDNSQPLDAIRSNLYPRIIGQLTE